MNPLQASRHRERHGVSGAKSDGADAHMLTDMVRTDSHQLRAARAYYDELPARGIEEATAWSHRQNLPQSSAAA